jgi:UV DNA damage endonuclease
MNRIRLGYTGANYLLRESKNIRINRKVSLVDVNEKGFRYLEKVTKKNLFDLYNVLRWNRENNIFVMRATNNLVPLLTDPCLFDINNREAYLHHNLFSFTPELEIVKEEIKKHNHRLTFHLPFQVKLASYDKYILDLSVYTIEKYAQLLEELCPENGLMVIHVGGIYGKDKEKTMQNWIDNYNIRLTKTSKKFLVLENDEYQYSLHNCLDISNACGIPVVCDFFHHECYNFIKNEKIEILITLPKIIDTWKDVRPKFHVSQQGFGRIGKHSELITSIPEELLQLSNKIDFDIILECKQSLSSLLHLRKIYKDG